MKTLITSVAMVLMGTLHAQNTLGDIIGTFVSTKGEGIYGAKVQTSSGSAVYNALTDPDGRFRISGIPAGTYSITIQFDTIKFESPVLAEVSPDGFGDIGIVVVNPTGVQLEKSTTLSDIEVTGRLRLTRGVAPEIKLSRKEILQHVSRQSVKDMVASMTTDIKKTDDGGLVFRGARKGDMIYYIDGVKLGEVQNVPSAAIGNIMVFSGAIPAKYGDTNGGVIVLETASYNDLYRNWMAMNGK